MFAGTGDKIVIHDAVNGVGVLKNAVEKVRFENGSTYELKHLITEAVPEQTESVTRYGTENDDLMMGSREQTTLYGRGGNDYLYGGAGNDQLYGGNNNDLLDGGSENDFLSGNEELSGGYSNSGGDTYVFGRGYGQDRIIDYDYHTELHVDQIQLNLNFEDVYFQRKGNDLSLFVEKSVDSLTIVNWYSGKNYQIEVFETKDGHQLFNTQVQQLIQAMSTFEINEGMDWYQAVRRDNETVLQILSEYWKSKQI